jgi:hypothetical protein
MVETNQITVIRSKASSLYMHVNGDGAEGSKVLAWDGVADVNAHWYIDRLGHGKCALRNARHNYYLALKDFGKNEGTALIMQKDCH